MILKPIIPVWIMALICIALLIFVAYDKHFLEKIKSNKDKVKTRAGPPPYPLDDDSPK